MIEHINILVIDDDDITAELVERALAPTGISYKVIAAPDGQDGLDLLRGKGLACVKRPFLILLDLNMPRMNGFEFLDAVRADPALADSVIFVLSTSSNDADRARAYHGQIAGFMTKTELGPQFIKLTNLLGDYAKAVHLPN